MLTLLIILIAGAISVSAILFAAGFKKMLKDGSWLSKEEKKKKEIIETINKEGHKHPGWFSGPGYQNFG